MKTMKEGYYDKANNLMERLMDEAPEDEANLPNEEETKDTGDQEETGQSGQVEIFFDNLDEETQKVLLDALKEKLKATEDDKLAHQKIIDALSKKPLVIFNVEELIRKLNIDI